MASAGKGGDNPEECPVCLTGFDDLVHRPRTLPCGHTVCTLCIDKLKEQGRVTCPECRVSHAVPEGGQFPVCYIVEALIRRMRDGKAAAAPAPASSLPRSGKGKGAAGSAGEKEAVSLSKKMCSFLQEQEATVVAAIIACQEAQSQLDQYAASLTGWGERQQRLENGLQGLMNKSKSARELLQQETSRVVAKKEEAKKREQKLQAVQEALRTLTTEQEALKAMGEVLYCTSEAKQVLEECQQCFPDAGILTTARKVREVSSAILEAAQALQAAPETVSAEGPRPQSDPEEPRPQSNHNLTIMEKVKLILEPSLKEPLQAEELHSLTQRSRSLVQAGRVFAVHQVKDQLRHARIILKAGRKFLHALEKQPLPQGAVTLQISQVVPLSPPCTVFLDLVWPYQEQRRVHIRLNPNTPRGRQFLMLCTGQRGPNYRGTRLLGVGDKGRPGECVYGGDYERNDGKGECVLLPGLDEGKYRRSDQIGAVFGGWGWGGKGLFAITTIKCAVGYMWDLVFGEVVEGLHVMKEAAQHNNIKEVTVVDCGVVL